MNSFFILPLAVAIGTAVLVLLLEAAGTPVGFRKEGRRTQLVSIALCALGAAIVQAVFTAPEPNGPLVWGALFADRWGFVGTLIALGLTVVVVVSLVPAAREFAADRGEVIASLLIGTAGTIGMCLADDLTVIAVAMTLQGVAAVALLVLDRRSGRGAEAAFKAHFGLLIRLLLWGMGTALLVSELGEHNLAAVVHAFDAGSPGALVGAVLILASLFCGLPIVPFAALQTDVAHGASSFAGAYAQAASLIGTAFLTARVLLVAPGSDMAVGVGYFVAASFAVTALAATDQRDLDRAFAHLFALQGAVVVTPLLTHDGAPAALASCATALVSAVVAVAGVSTARGSVMRTERALPTWERWSGAGRKNPYFALALLICAGSLVGLPGTAGFWARLEGADAGLKNGQLLLSGSMVLSCAVASLVVVRLGFFLFAKSPDPRRVTIDIGGWRTVALFLCTAMVLALGVGAQWVNAALAHFLTFATFAP